MIMMTPCRTRDIIAVVMSRCYYTSDVYTCAPKCSSTKMSREYIVQFRGGGEIEAVSVYIHVYSNEKTNTLTRYVLT